MNNRFTLDVVQDCATSHVPFSDTGQIEICNCPVPFTMHKRNYADAHIVFHSAQGDLHLVTAGEHASVTNIRTKQFKSFKHWHTVKLQKYLIRTLGTHGTHQMPKATTLQRLKRFFA